MGWGIFQLFETADDAQVFVGHRERPLGALLPGVGLADLLADPRLDSNPKRVAAREWLLPRVDAELARYLARRS